MLVNFDLSKVLDIEQSIKTIHGDKNMYYKMLARVEKMTLNPHMESIANSISAHDWATVSSSADTLMGSSGYVGAGYMYYACSYIMQAHSEKNYIDMAKYYQLLVEAAIEFQRYSRRLIAQENCKELVKFLIIEFILYVSNWKTFGDFALAN